MQISLKIALIIILVIYLLCIVKAVKKKNMRINYLIFWSITGIILIIALLVPNLVEDAASLLGFEMPINMIFSIAIFIILYLIYNLTTLISKEQNRNILLIQEISTLKKRVEELEKNNK
ncbi:MAG: DUF2304 domain-containing protein [Clostridia bacterium]|nr:DUF2304 domain-containing protein [Clostridia bacterium]